MQQAQKNSRTRKHEPSRYVADTTCCDGRLIHLRAIRPDDKASLQAFFSRMSPEARYQRFLEVKSQLSDEELQYFTEVDFREHVALVAIFTEGSEKRIAGVGRYIVTRDVPDKRAELAISVDETEQGHGIGSLLVAHLAKIAIQSGIHAFEIDTLANNTAMLRLGEGVGEVLSRSSDCGVVHLVARIDLPAEVA